MIAVASMHNAAGHFQDALKLLTNAVTSASELPKDHPLSGVSRLVLDNYAM
jgi:hypothetical protein